MLFKSLVLFSIWIPKDEQDILLVIVSFMPMVFSTLYQVSCNISLVMKINPIWFNTLLTMDSRRFDHKSLSHMQISEVKSNPCLHLMTIAFWTRRRLFNRKGEVGNQWSRRKEGRKITSWLKDGNITTWVSSIEGMVMLTTSAMSPYIAWMKVTWCHLCF